MLWDVLSWFLATLLFIKAYYDFTFSDSTMQDHAFVYAGLCAAIQIIAGWSVKLYRGRASVGSFGEVTTLSLVVLIIGVVIGFPLMFRSVDFKLGFSRGVAATVPIIVLALQFAFRLMLRMVQDRQLERSARKSADPVLVYGAGNAGQQIGRLIALDPDSPYRVVGYLDDDPSKRNLHLGRARVLGSSEQLVRAIKETGARKVIMAISTASRELLHSISDTCDDQGVELLIMPPVEDIVSGRQQLSQMHQISVEDLLGRGQIQTNLEEIADYLEGRTVLITGAGGSIGSEIARQVHKFHPRELVLLDRDEGGLHAVELSIYGQALLDTPNMVLCDIRDAEALEAVFARHQPQVVFHAAALKHLPMLEQYPLEGWKTNCLGTANVLAAASRHGVRNFVNISTDKAADATSVLGKTKRIAEELTAWYGENSEGTFVSVRFGNVLGSRGSMLHTFQTQIEQGGPVTVTHPDIERYFMTIREACELVIQAGAIGRCGDVMVLDMGEPVKILNVAKGLIARSGKKDIEIVFTGLRSGEKLSEVLFSGQEDARTTSHPLISCVSVPPLDPAGLPSYDVASLQPATAGATAVEDMTELRAARAK